MAHEQSETTQDPTTGKWGTVYGRNTPNAGQRIPGTRQFPDLDTAEADARLRSMLENTSPGAAQVQALSAVPPPPPTPPPTSALGAVAQTLASPPVGSFAQIMRRLGGAGAEMFTTPLERPIVDELGNVHYGGKEVPPGGRPATLGEVLKTAGDYASLTIGARGGVGKPKFPNTRAMYEGRELTPQEAAAAKKVAAGQPTFFTGSKKKPPVEGEEAAKTPKQPPTLGEQMRGKIEAASGERDIVTAPLARQEVGPSRRPIYPASRETAQLTRQARTQEIYAAVQDRVRAGDYEGANAILDRLPASEQFSKPARERLLTPRVAVDPRSLEVTPSTAFTPGQPTARQIMGDQRFWRQLEEIEFPLVREASIREAARIKAGMPPTEVLDPNYWTRGKFNQTWYTGAYPGKQQFVRQLQAAAPRAKNIDVERDPELLTWLFASTSPRNEPFINTDLGLWDAYLKFLQAGRNPAKVDLRFPSGKPWMPAHAQNALRAMRNIGGKEPFDPISGPKVGSYGLGHLGAEQWPPMDRWAAADVHQVKTTQIPPNMSRGTMYQVSADVMRDVARGHGTTPIRGQAGRWTGGKLQTDWNMADLIRQGLTDEQVVPAIREIERSAFDQFIQAVRRNPKMIEPLSVAGLAAVLERAWLEQGVDLRPVLTGQGGVRPEGAAPPRGGTPMPSSRRPGLS